MFPDSFEQRTQRVERHLQPFRVTVSSPSRSVRLGAREIGWLRKSIDVGYRERISIPLPTFLLGLARYFRRRSISHHKPGSVINKLEDP